MLTVRPVRLRYHVSKPRAYSARIASLCGVTITTVSSARAADGRFGRNTNGTAIVTAEANDGPRGFLALSPTHLTADPPILMVSVDNKTSALKTMLDAGHFAINYLASTQGELVGVFGGKGELKGADRFTLFWGLALISLAVTASTAAVVALVGPAGSLIGGLYFTVGLIISGSSIAPEMLPKAGHTVGQLLPPGAGATVARDAMYFPDAATAGAFVVLAAYALGGLAVILSCNAAANRTRFAQALLRH